MTPASDADVAAVGLTGGIGAGKSTALRFFARGGRSHAVRRRGGARALRSAQDVKRALAEHFGPEVLAADGERGPAAAGRGGARPAGASCAGSSRSLIRWWRRRSTRFISEAPAGSVVVCEVPLLFEAGMRGPVRPASSPWRPGPTPAGSAPSTRFDLEQFAEFEALQASSERRVAGSDLAFFNDGRCRHLRAFVDDAYERARRSCDAGRGRGGRDARWVRPLTARGAGAAGALLRIGIAGGGRWWPS